MNFKSSIFCTCAYCEYFRLAEYYEFGNIIRQGICKKHKKLCEMSEAICDDFVILKGLQTNKYYPKKDNSEK